MQKISTNLVKKLALIVAVGFFTRSVKKFKMAKIEKKGLFTGTSKMLYQESLETRIM